VFWNWSEKLQGVHLQENLPIRGQLGEKLGCYFRIVMYDDFFEVGTRIDIYEGKK
jgi:hypothetical protein